MMGQAFPNTISRTAAVAPGLMVMAVILFMGKVSGAHLNPAVSVASSLRGDFPWRRVPGYIIAQLDRRHAAALFLHAVINVSSTYGSNYPAAGYSAGSAFLMEVLTFGLVSVILGTASGAQNIGVFGAIGVGAYIALAGLWEVNLRCVDESAHVRAESCRHRFHKLLGLRGGPTGRRDARGGSGMGAARPGGGRAGSVAAQGNLYTEIEHPDKA